MPITVLENLEVSKKEENRAFCSVHAVVTVRFSLFHAAEQKF